MGSLYLYGDHAQPDLPPDADARPPVKLGDKI